MRPHATLRPRLTSNTSHTPPPSPSQCQLLIPAVAGTTHFAFQTIGGEGEGRRRRRRRKNRRCSRSSVVLAGTERLRRSACGLKVMLAPTLTIPSCISPLPSLFDSSLEIRRDSGDLAMRRRSRRRRSSVLAVFDGTGQFCRRRGGGLAGVVLPVRRHTLVVPWDRAVVFRSDSCALLQIGIYDQFGENFGDEFQAITVAIEP